MPPVTPACRTRKARDRALDGRAVARHRGQRLRGGVDEVAQLGVAAGELARGRRAGAHERGQSARVARQRGQRPAALLEPGPGVRQRPMKGGSVTYRVEPDGAGSRVSIRNTGPGPQIVGWFVRRSVAKDLDRLAKLVTR